MADLQRRDRIATAFLGIAVATAAGMIYVVSRVAQADPGRYGSGAYAGYGYSGYEGYSGYDGYAGYDGYSGYEGYSGYDGYSGYSPSAPKRGSALEEQLLKNADCRWVNHAGEGARAVRTVSAYPFRGCGDSGDHPPQICTGTAQCDVSLPKRSGAVNFTLFVEDVVCTSSHPGHCPDAAKCMRDGGVLSEVQVGDIAGIPANGSQSIAPGEVPVQNETHR